MALHKNPDSAARCCSFEKTFLNGLHRRGTFGARPYAIMTTMPGGDWIRRHKKTVAAAALGAALLVTVALGIFWFGWDWKALIGWKALLISAERSKTMDNEFYGKDVI